MVTKHTEWPWESQKSDYYLFLHHSMSKNLSQWGQAITHAHCFTKLKAQIQTRKSSKLVWGLLKARNHLPWRNVTWLHWTLFSCDWLAFVSAAFRMGCVTDTLGGSIAPNHCLPTTINPQKKKNNQLLCNLSTVPNGALSPAALLIVHTFVMSLKCKPMGQCTSIVLALNLHLRQTHAA